MALRLSKMLLGKRKVTEQRYNFLFKVEVLFILLLWINKRLLVRGPSHFGCHRCKSQDKYREDVEIQKQKRSFIINCYLLSETVCRFGHCKNFVYRVSIRASQLLELLSKPPLNSHHTNEKVAQNSTKSSTFKFGVTYLGLLSICIHFLG